MKKIILSLLLGLTLYSAKSQLIVFSTLPSGAILQNNFTGNGVQIDNVVFSGANGAGGVFSGSNSNIGLSNGIILSTGNVTGAIGPNSSGSFGTNIGRSGDTDLEQLLGDTIPTYDAAVLEFDVISSSDSIYLKLVYASEEYSEGIGQDFADPIGVYISGPGFSVPTNLAYLLGTSEPISINSINSTINSNLYIDNTNGTTVQYDGFTKPILIKAQVVPCQIYHVKIAIADAGDQDGDSGLFLDAGSLQSGTSNSTVCQMNNEFISADESCFGACDGSVSILQVNGGFPPYTFAWSNGQSGSNATNLCPGNYELIITDHVGNKDTFSFDILGPTALQVSSNNPAIVCNSDTFTVDLQISGGTSPYSILSFSTQPIDTIDSVTYSFIAGSGQDYQIYIEDANGCGFNQIVPILVEGFGHLNGQIFLNNSLNYLNPSQSIEVTLLKKTSINMVWEVKEVQNINDQNLDKSFSFGGIQSGLYVILAKVLPDNMGGLVLPTYSGDKYLWSKAVPDTFGTNCSLLSHDIHLVNNIDSAQGLGSLEGNIFLSDYFKTESSTDPIPLIDIVVEKDSTPSISTDNTTSFFPWNSTYAIEQVIGSQIFPYKFPLMPDGVYKVKVQIPGIPMVANYPIAFTTLTVNNDSIVNINFCADSFMLGRIDTCISTIPIGMSELKYDELTIFPNPSQGNFIVNWGGQGQNFNFSLFNAVGKLIYEKEIGSGEGIDLHALNLEGIYFAEIRRLNLTERRKLLFQLSSH
jgi:hypothetical protein